MDVQAAQALIRFGLGRRGTEDLPADPQAWLAAQLDGPDPALAMPGTSTADGLAALQALRHTPAEQRKDIHPLRDIFRADAAQAMDTMLTTDTPFRERLVWFWANHFTVSVRQGQIAEITGAYVRETIRPHVNGRFRDMLFAVMRHPTMLMYLQNAQSVGPNSIAGLRQHRGLNENLARENLELHTLSPASGYTQADVTEYARILTGWSIQLNQPPAGFLFRPNAHEPGPKTLMGQTFPAGEAGGIAALTWIADHPWTHRHLATKLVRHFVADDPPPEAVKRVEGVLRDTHGDLKAASLELIRLPEAWQPLTKLRTPQDYVISVLRALDLPADKRPDAHGAMNALGQPFFNAPLPNGWGDTAQDWGGPETILRRVDWAYGVSARAGQIDAADLANDNMGPLLRAATLDQIRGAGSRREAMTLLLTSPEFQRR
ncbi:MAG TPA: DUF1800 domain-containing protein [Acetobacteraceae bacterium]|jgi:uncharacterized protein (DUF1800 family)